MKKGENWVGGKIKAGILHLIETMDIERRSKWKYKKVNSKMIFTRNDEGKRTGISLIEDAASKERQQ